MRTTIFRVASALLGFAFVAVGLIMFFDGSLDRASHLMGAIAIVGTGLYFLKYAMTGTRTLFAHRFKAK
jgi:hypothetical protein